ncbi:MAG: DsbC family protein [Chromatiales bacterium]
MRCVSAFLTVALSASSAGGALAADESQIKQEITAQLAAVVPDMKVNGVRPAPIPGWYEVLLGAKLIYVSADARYILDGTLMDLKAQKDLTSGPAMEARAAALKALTDSNKVIEFAPDGKAEHIIYVFTDTECTYCRKMHSEVSKLNAAGIAVRYIAFPRDGIGSPTYEQMVSVWCAKDPKQALTDAKAGKKLPPAACDNPVKEEFELGTTMNVRGTPTTILENGEEAGGYIPADALINFFRRGAS